MYDRRANRRVFSSVSLLPVHSMRTRACFSFIRHVTGRGQYCPSSPWHYVFEGHDARSVRAALVG